MKIYKRYIIYVTYRGVTVAKQCTAKSAKEAAEKLDISYSFIKGYGMITKVSEPIEGVQAWMDSDFIIYQEGRRDLWEKKISWDEMKEIINFYVNKRHEDKSK